MDAPKEGTPKTALDRLILAPKRNVHPSEPLPLFRDSGKAMPFPLDALADLKPVVEAITEKTQAPAAMCAQAVLAAVTLAVQARKDVELPGAGRGPLTGLFATIGESGERKTSVDKLALAPVYAAENVWMAEWITDNAAYKIAKARYDAKPEEEDEPKAPQSPMLLMSDLTAEGLVLHLKQNRPWAGVFTSEGGLLVGGHAFSKDKLLQTAALLNILWDGGTIRRTRAGTGFDLLQGRRCSAHLMMQQVVADMLLGDPVLSGVGLLARVLIVSPESKIGNRPFREASRQGGTALSNYGMRMHGLLMPSVPTMPGTSDVLDPQVMTLSSDARTRWIEFYNEVERHLKPDGALHSIRGFGAKLAEHAARLSAVLMAYHDPRASEVDDLHMQSGIELANHYACEMLRVAGGSEVPQELREANDLLEWWKAQPQPHVHVPMLCRYAPNALRSNKKIKRAIAILEEHGHIRRLPEGVELLDNTAKSESEKNCRKKRSDAWTLTLE